MNAILWALYIPLMSLWLVAALSGNWHTAALLGIAGVAVSIIGLLRVIWLIDR